MKLITISAIEFVARLRHSLMEHRQRICWFLGAGCSVSSGIPSAGGLVEIWLRQLYEMQKNGPAFHEWVRTEFPEFDFERPAKYYAQVLSRRHPSSLERQREIELICSRGEPGYGYATLAQLISHPEIGHLCNTVLTTNFDDLLADAIYLYGAPHSRPQVISHESLTMFARLTSPRPIVVKLHGDAHIQPRNVGPETSLIRDDVRRHLGPFLTDSALIFTGYGGNDKSISDFFDRHSEAILMPQTYWIGSELPTSDVLRKWLARRGALQVDHQDFDHLMHLIRGAFSLQHPDAKKRIAAIDENYFKRYAELEKQIDDLAESAEKDALEKASDAARASLPDVWEQLSRARRLEVTDPIAAAELYAKLVEEDPPNPLVLMQYADFLWKIRKDNDRAEEVYKKAIAGDSPWVMLDYANFLYLGKKDFDAAETYFKRVITEGPDRVPALLDYSDFLCEVRHDLDGAEAKIRTAIDVDPSDDVAQNYYANFLWWHRKNLDAAAVQYLRGIQIERGIKINSLGYAALLLTKGEKERAAPYLKRASRIPATSRFSVRLHFLYYAFFPDKAMRSLARLKSALPRTAPSPRFNLTPIISRAISDGHESPQLLRDIGRVMQGEANVDVLASHSEWLEANTGKVPRSKQKL